MNATADRQFSRPTAMLAQWAGWGLPALAWALHLSGSYLLVGWACERGAVAVLHGVSVLALALALCGVAIAWHNWRTAGRQWPDDGGGARQRSRFVGALGVLMGLLFAAIVAMQSLPSFVVPPCL